MLAALLLASIDDVFHICFDDSVDGIGDKRRVIPLHRNRHNFRIARKVDAELFPKPHDWVIRLADQLNNCRIRQLLFLVVQRGQEHIVPQDQLPLRALEHFKLSRDPIVTGKQIGRAHV